MATISYNIIGHDYHTIRLIGGMVDALVSKTNPF